MGVLGWAGGLALSPPYQATPALIRGLCAVYIQVVRPPRQNPVMPSRARSAFGCLPAHSRATSRSAKHCSSVNLLAAANKLTDEQCFADLDVALEWAGKQPKADLARLGITGFCRGGRTTWMYTAHNPRIKAGVAWYGGLNANPPAQPKTPIDIAGQLHAPVLGLYGGKDQGIPQAAVDKLKAALKAAGKDKESRIHVYPDAGHAFNADYRPSYRKEAAEDGWKRMLAWFAKHGVA